MFGIKTLKKGLAFGAKVIGDGVSLGQKVAGKVSTLAAGAAAGIQNAYDVASHAPIIGDAVKTFAPQVASVIGAANKVSQTANRVKGVLDVASAVTGGYKDRLER